MRGGLVSVGPGHLGLRVGDPSGPLRDLASPRLLRWSGLHHPARPLARSPRNDRPAGSRHPLIDLIDPMGQGVLSLGAGDEHGDPQHQQPQQSAPNQPPHRNLRGHLQVPLPEVPPQPQETGRQQQPQRGGDIHHQQLEGIPAPHQVTRGNEQLAQPKQGECGEREVHNPRAGLAGALRSRAGQRWFAVFPVALASRLLGGSRIAALVGQGQAFCQRENFSRVFKPGRTGRFRGRRGVRRGGGARGDAGRCGGVRL